MRKIQAFFLSSMFVALLCACKSEYSQRLSRGLELKKELIELLKASDATSQLKVKAIRKELVFHAQVSGNEELFFEQLGIK